MTTPEDAMVDESHASEGAAHDGQGDRPHDGQPPVIDIARLAEKVYALMREELRLERARGSTRARSW